MYTTVAAEQTVSLAPHEVFALFGSAHATGWLFSARCDAVAPGAIVSMQLPLDERGGTRGVDILGRLTRVVPGATIDIEHTQPWRGISLRFRPAGARRTRVQVRASVPLEGVQWLLQPGRLALPFERHLVGSCTSIPRAMPPTTVALSRGGVAGRPGTPSDPATWSPPRSTSPRPVRPGWRSSRRCRRRPGRDGARRARGHHRTCGHVIATRGCVAEY